MVVSFPKVKPGKELPIGGGFGSQGRCLTAHVWLPEQEAPNTPGGDTIVLVEQVLFGRDLADDGGKASIRGYYTACVMGGVDSLDDLLRE
jgi:hypothetical protein